MLGWLNATAEWAGPIAAILNFVIAAVGLPIAIWKGFQARRVIVAWFENVLGSAKDASEQSIRAADNAEVAARSAGIANESADGARQSADSARDNSRQANELLEWAVPELMRRDAVIDELRGRIDRLLGTRARELAQQATTGGLLIPAAAGDDDDPITVTGRHRFHTQQLRTIDEEDRP